MDATDEDIANENDYFAKRCIILDGQASSGTYFASINKTAIITDEINNSDSITLANSFNTTYKIYPII